MRSIKEPSFDPTEDLRQAGNQLEIIRYLALAIFVILAGRLWYLQVMNSTEYAERAKQNRTRIIPIPAQRGTIFDRNGNELVTSQSMYNIVISRDETINKINFDELAPQLIANLDIDPEWLSQRFEAAKYEAKWESIVVKELATDKDVAWVEAHNYEFPMIRAELAPRRLYRFNTMAAHALGYVGEVGRKELDDPKSDFSSEKGFKLGDIIGKAGIERTYNHILMGQDGEQRVQVDSKGRFQKEIERIEPIPGRNLYTTLDLNIQKLAEEQTDTMPAGRGVIVIADPNNGEILALVSHPAYDPNLFSLRSKTDAGKGEILHLQEDPDKPLFNRVIQGTYPPGSTWKLMTAVAALNEGLIDDKTRIQDGGIQVGDYFMKSMSHLGFPDVYTAISHSSDGFFYRLGLKIGPVTFEKWMNNFRFGELTGIDLPREAIGIKPTRATKKREVENVLKRQKRAKGEEWTPKDDERVEKLAQWTAFDMVNSAFGQGRNALTPIQLLRYVNGLAVGGKMHTPHLFLRAVDWKDRQGNYYKEIKYEDKNIFEVPMSQIAREVVRKGMWQAVSGRGTGYAANVDGFDVCGKTGTAQMVSTDKATTKTQDHAWFMGFAPRDKPELGWVILTENAGQGGRQSAPRARPILEDYYRRTRGVTIEETKAEK
jgi:penicillin-binding protein 2